MSKSELWDEKSSFRRVNVAWSGLLKEQPFEEAKNDDESVQVQRSSGHIYRLTAIGALVGKRGRIDSGRKPK